MLNGFICDEHFVDPFDAVIASSGKMRVRFVKSKGPREQSPERIGLWDVGRKVTGE
jgi:hypothetical protein